MKNKQIITDRIYSGYINVARELAVIRCPFRLGEVFTDASGNDYRVEDIGAPARKDLKFTIYARRLLSENGIKRLGERVYIHDI